MSCLYCGSHFSSKWEEENKRFGMYENKPKTVAFGWDTKQPDLDYDKMLADFWTYLHEKDRYLHIRQYQIAGGEPFHQVELEASIDFWDNHPNPELTFNFITNLKVTPKKFRSTIDRLGRMVDQGKLKRVQISSSLDAWGPQQEYVRWGLDLAEWQENFEYLLSEKWIVLNINQTISPLTIKTMPELLELLVKWRSVRKVCQFFSSVTPEPTFLNPDIFGPGVFDDDFKKIISLMPDTTQEENNAISYMTGIWQSIEKSPINIPEMQNMFAYLNEKDRRRKTDWRTVFPWLIKYEELCGITK